jgi:hypothetical protein
MNIPSGPSLNAPAEPPASGAAQPSATSLNKQPAPSANTSPTDVATVTKSPASEPQTVTPSKPSEPLTDVSLRLDTNGRVYYVVSDPSSGQEILEVPPKALRDVDQGIADYLKELQTKATSHVKVSA